MHKVTVQNEPRRLTAVVAHKGAYPKIGSAMEKAGELIAKSGRMADIAAVIAVYHDNPDNVAEADLRSHAGFVLRAGCHAPDGLEAMTLQGGRYAVCTYVGAYSGLKDVYAWLFGTWLQESNEEFDPASSFEIYLNSPMDTPEDKLITKIYLPLAEEDFNGPV